MLNYNIYIISDLNEAAYERFFVLAHVNYSNTDLKFTSCNLSVHTSSSGSQNGLFSAVNCIRK